MAQGSITTSEMDDQAWDSLLERISRGNCTPFIGPGARTNFPDAYEVARAWAHQHGYPLGDCLDLPKVARYLAVKRDPKRPKEEIAKLYNSIKRPDFKDPATKDEPHRALAELPFPFYITTNQDDLMLQALVSNKRDAKRDLCRWNDFGGVPRSVFHRDNPPYTPTPANPLVFHLYGYTECLDSLVVTDDDYLGFLANISKDESSRDERMMPAQVVGAMQGASLLLGYRLDDWDFRVLFHLIINHMVRAGMTHVAVQLAPAEGKSATAQEEEVKKQLEVYRWYVGAYFQSKSLKIHVSLQTCQEFVVELRERWRSSTYA
jgi:hypothetical protein